VSLTESRPELGSEFAADLEADLAADLAAEIADGSGEGGGGAQPGGPQPPQAVLFTCLTAFLATAGFAWMVAGLFAGSLAKLVALAALLLGTGSVYASYRSRRPSLVQYAGLGVLVVFAAALLAQGQSQGGSLPTQLLDTLRSGGLGHPPVAFDPGWRFLVVAILGFTSAAAASLALALRRPRLALAIPAPLIVATALLEPAGAQISATIPALGLLLAGLAVGFGGDLQREGSFSGSFEARRLAGGVGAILVLVAGLAGLSHLGFLFPPAKSTQVTPPMLPTPSPPVADHPLFTVASPTYLTWRTGELDVYRDTHWLTPPYDPASLQPLGPGGTLPGRAAHGRPTITVTFTVTQLDGHVLPSLAGMLKVTGDTRGMRFDPRARVLSEPDRTLTRGLTYTVTALAPPTGAELAAAPAPGAAFRQFLAVPPPPPAVAALLARAPSNPFDRLQFLRQAYYAKAVATGSGQPIAVPASVVSAVLSGHPESPYAITAGEVLLARWAGVPARIGFGYFGGHPGSGELLTVKPDNGAAWLEGYFRGYGWVPIVGTPPRAQVALNQARKNPNRAVRPSNQLTLSVYVPIQLRGVEAFYVAARYWLAVSLPILFGLFFAVAYLPVPLRMLRRARRRRWAGGAGPRARIAAAYAELRDTAADLGVGAPSQHPLAFLDSVAADAEHTELAWLVTRTLWGDLARDTGPGDAAAAEEMAASVTRRLRRAASPLARMLAAASRNSLREPYSRELPNLWPARAEPVRRVRRGPRPVGLASRARAFAGRLRPARPLRLAVISAAVAVALGVGAFAAQGVTASPITPGGRQAPLPTRLAPARLAAFTITRQRSAESDFTRPGSASLVNTGRVYVIRQGATVQASLQVARFRPGLSANSLIVREGVLSSLANGQFLPVRIGDVHAYDLITANESLYLAFSPNGAYYELLVAQPQFTDAGPLFAGLLSYAQGGNAASVLAQRQVPVPNPIEGSPQ
jgi:hypothetical protein